MELTTLNKELKLLHDENTDKFIKMTAIDPHINSVEEYWITSDHTLGNSRAFFDSFKAASEYASARTEYRMKLNADGQKPFSILVNGKETAPEGALSAFLNGEFEIDASQINLDNVRKLYM